MGGARGEIILPPPWTYPLVFPDQNVLLVPVKLSLTDYFFQIKLLYFDLYGRGEIIRLILNYAGVEFTVKGNKKYF